MYAVVEIGGRQYTVVPRDKVSVPTMGQDAGDTVTFDRVLLFGDSKKITVGNPVVSGAQVEARVLEHGKEDKVTVFKKKKRKGYRVRRGHRQGYTRIEITKISA
ncbi:MAG: 50S ribosomal protein L21 [Bacteroidetes bacterium]|nr:50S ribosomal protein L21 [Bacteroidota bacterium]